MRLRVKVVLGLLVIAAVPLLVSAVLVDQIAVVAQNFASNEAARLRPPLERAQGVYKELVAARKEGYRQSARRIGALMELPDLTAEPVDLPAVYRALGKALDEPDVQRIALRDATGGVLAEAVSDRLPSATGRWRDLTVVDKLPTGHELVMTFVTRVDFLDDYEALGGVLSARDRVAAVRRALPESYRKAFLVVVGGVVFVVTGAGIFVAGRLARRIETLAAATRDVAAGNLDVRVAAAGRDELGELSGSFNRMVAQLERDREQITYLHKIGAWQDAGRQLAHEIKNPLTPIQLAVQQVVSSYKGDDERFRRLLGDMDEIVTEEIGNLRRLVDAFRSLGRLPEAQLARLELGSVVDDVARDPAVADKLEVDAPGAEIHVDGDRLLLRRVLANLVENGIQAGEAMGKRGTVHLAWSVDDDTGRAVITVDDEGAGVPEEKRAQIFDPYFTTKDTGTGLGLAIAKKILLDHRGTLVLAAEPSPAGGARFVLSLPIAS